MNKLIAIMVALLLAVLPVASAETVALLSDPVLAVDMGESFTIDLTGLTIQLAAGQAGNVPALQIDIFGDGEKLYGISVNLTQDKILLCGDGMSQALSVDIPAEVTNLTSMDFSNVNLDTEALMQTLMSGIETDGTTVRIPYTTVNEVFAQIIPALEGVAIPGLDASELESAVEQLKNSNSGITLEGSYSETDTGADFFASAYMVENGVAASDSLFDLSVSASNDAFSLTFTVTGQGTFTFSYQGGLVSLGVDASGTGFNLSVYVSTADADVTFVSLDGANAINVMDMDENQLTQVQNELMGGVSGLINFIYGAVQNAA